MRHLKVKLFWVLCPKLWLPGVAAITHKMHTEHRSPKFQASVLQRGTLQMQWVDVRLLQKINLSNLNEGDQRDKEKTKSMIRSWVCTQHYVCIYIWNTVQQLSLQLKEMITAKCPSTGGFTTAVTLTKSVECQWNPGVKLKQLCRPNLIPSLLLLLSWRVLCQQRHWLYTNPMTSLLSITKTQMNNNHFWHLLLMLFTLFVTPPQL